VKIIFWGLSLEIWYRNVDSYLDDFRKEHSIADPLFAQEIGRQTPHGLTENRQRVKISFRKTWAIFFSLHVNAPPRRSPVKISSKNQQILLQK